MDDEDADPVGGPLPEAESFDDRVLGVSESLIRYVEVIAALVLVLLFAIGVFDLTLRIRRPRFRGSRPARSDSNSRRSSCSVPASRSSTRLSSREKTSRRIVRLVISRASSRWSGTAVTSAPVSSAPTGRAHRRRSLHAHRPRARGAAARRASDPRQAPGTGERSRKQLSQAA